VVLANDDQVIAAIGCNAVRSVMISFAATRLGCPFEGHSLSGREVDAD
jgi:hypothetical protein